MGRRRLIQNGLALGIFLTTSLLIHACSYNHRALTAAAPLMESQAGYPAAVQTPPIGPTPPPHGNFMVEFSVPTANAWPRGIKFCGYNMCVTEYNASKVDILTTKGDFHVYSTPTSGSGPFGVSQGSDKNFWFTEAAANKIGRLTPTGQITEFPIPTAASFPTGIWNGDPSTRLMWFTESAANQIASIDIDTGVVAEYRIPTPNSDPESITKDKDGSIWFVEHAANKVGTISLAGAIKEFDIPSKNSGADSITYVEDGNVWFTEPRTGKIARVRVPSGAITEYVVPYAHSRPTAITQGDTVNHGYDGNGDPFKKDDQVWFTDDGLNAVSGYSYFTATFDKPIRIPTRAAGSGAVSLGPDNNIWFVEQTADKVGAYHLPTPAPSAPK